MTRRMPAVLDDTQAFPSPERASPEGLLAIGGDLAPPRLLAAYRQGIFPWYSAGQPILWWSPDPRMVFRSDGVHLSSRFRRSLRASTWCVRADTCFDTVVDACAAPRAGQRGTWITPAMRRAYGALHRLGHAHSVEVFDGEGLVGGLYGVSVGTLFCAESMFSGESGGSKVALAALAHRLREWGWPLIDAQVENEHLASLGGQPMPRSEFLAQVSVLSQRPHLPGAWTDRFGAMNARELGLGP